MVAAIARGDQASVGRGDRAAAARSDEAHTGLDTDTSRVGAQTAGLSGAGRPVLAVTATTREAEDLAASLGDLLPADEVAVYPSWETLPHERLSPRSDTVGRREHVQQATADGELAPLSHQIDAGIRQFSQLADHVIEVGRATRTQLDRFKIAEPLELRLEHRANGRDHDPDRSTDRVVEIGMSVV